MVKCYRYLNNNKNDIIILLVCWLLIEYELNMFLIDWSIFLRLEY